jgi:sulfatase modifying factor 1
MKKVLLFLIFLVFIFFIYYSCAFKYNLTDQLNDNRGANSSSISAPGFFSSSASTSSASSSFYVDLIDVPGGTFSMGGTTTSLPIHNITITGFKISKIETTYYIWSYVKAWAESQSIPYGFHSNGLKGSTDGSTDDHPVTSIDWYDAVAWCNALSEIQGLTPVYYTDSGYATKYINSNDISVFADWNATGYRLPTEAEWEFSSRYDPGPPVKFQDPIDISGGTNSQKDIYSWWNGNSNNQTHPAAKKLANKSGIYDMTGNVKEWCWDWYDSNYYNVSVSVDPKGPASGTNRVMRGGAYKDAVNNLQVSDRDSNLPDGISIEIGFRVVKKAP